MKIRMNELKRIIREVIQESFWNKYGQPLGSRFQGGELYQSYGKIHSPDPKFDEMRDLLRGFQRKCHRHSLGNEMYMSGYWTKLAIGVLGEVSCHDGTEKPVVCKIKFKREQLVFTEPEELESFLSEPELLAMQKDQTDRLNAKY